MGNFDKHLAIKRIWKAILFDFAISDMGKSFLVLLDSRISLSMAMVETAEGSTAINGGFDSNGGAIEGGKYGIVESTLGTDVGNY